MSRTLKISEKYEPLFAWLSAKKSSPLHGVDTVVMTGGRHSQKSFATGLWSCVAAKDYNHRILYTRYTLTAAQDSIVPEFEEKIDLLNCASSFIVKNGRIDGTTNRSKIVFKGHKTSSGNQTASLKSLKDFSIFITEEAEEVPTFQDWDKIRKSIRAVDVRNLNILILNPATKEHWVFEEFFEDRGVPEGFNGVKDNVLYIHASYLDMEREHIADAIWFDFEDKRKAYELYEKMTPEQRQRADRATVKKWSYFKHVVLGGWLDRAEGVIYDTWTIGDFREIGVPVYGQDYGFSVDPTTLVRVSIDRAQKKIYLKEQLYKPLMVTSEIIRKNKEIAGNHLIIADSAEPRLIAEIKKGGVNIREAFKPPGSITAGIAMMQDYELVIDPSSINLIKELNNYVWHDKKSKTPVDAWNHLLDAARYVVFTLLSKVVVQNRGG